MATGCSYASSATSTSTVQQQSMLGICVKTSGQNTQEHHQDKENGEACLELRLLCACTPDLLAGGHRAGAWR